MNRQEIITVTLPAHMASWLVNGCADSVTTQEIQAVEKQIEGLEIIDVARDAEGEALEPRFSWSFFDYGGTYHGGDVLDYIAIEMEEKCR